MPVEWSLSYVDLDLLNRHEGRFNRHPQVVRAHIDEISVRDDRRTFYLQVVLRDSYDPSLHPILERWRQESLDAWRAHQEEERRRNPPPPIDPQQIVQQFIDSQANRARLAMNMVAPLRQRRDYTSVGRRIFMVEQLPEGALPVFNREPESPARRVEFPMFELSSNPTIPISAIRARRFDVIERSQDMAHAERQAREDEAVFRALDRLGKRGRIEPLAATQELPDWVRVGARMRSMVPEELGVVTITNVYWADREGNPCSVLSQHRTHRVIVWQRDSVEGFWTTAHNWFCDDWQYEEPAPAWWDRLGLVA